jgi:hypothetical protein
LPKANKKIESREMQRDKVSNENECTQENMKGYTEIFLRVRISPGTK